MVPTLPEAGSNVAAYPSLQSEDVSALFGQPVVCPPAPNIGAPAVPQFFTGLTLAAAPHLSNLRFESLHARRSRFDLPLRVDTKSQELAFPGPSRSALAGVDFQSEVFGYPLGHALQYSLGRPGTAHVDVA